MEIVTKDIVEIAKEIAFKAHEGQTTRDGLPYILHPLHVAKIVDPLNIHPKLRAIAILHDVIEDTDYTAEDLANAGIPDVVINGVLAVTKIDGEDYNVYVKKVMLNYRGTLVKIADMTHNMDLTRLPKITKNDVKRNRKYRLMRKMLINHIKNV